MQFEEVKLIIYVGIDELVKEEAVEGTVLPPALSV